MPNNRAKQFFHVLLKCLLSIASGILLFLACPIFNLWPLVWIAFLPLLIAIFDQQCLPKTRHAFWYGLLTGFTAISGLCITQGGFSWMIQFLERFIPLPYPYSPLVPILIFMVFSTYHGLIFALLAKLICFLRTELNISLTWILALSWATFEFCFPCIFPWYLAFTQVPFLPIIQIADVTGVIGVSFLIGLGNGALFELGCALFSKKRSFSIFSTPLTAAGLIILSIVYGLVRIHQVHNLRSQAPKIKVGLVQSNIGLNEKSNSQVNIQSFHLHKHQQISEELSKKGVDLIIWPEGAYSFPIFRPSSKQPYITIPQPPRTWKHIPLLFGALTFDRNHLEKPYNSALLIDESGQISGPIDKNFLLIFGEYVPFLTYMPWLKTLVPDISDLEPGTEPGTLPFKHQGKIYPLGMMICYEDILPNFGRRLFDRSDPPNLLINLTKDTWFGKTAEPYQHAALSVFRAIEHRVDLVRATNTGVSAFIDATGKITAQGPVEDPWDEQIAATSLVGEAALLVPGGYYQSLGDTFGYICLGVIAFLGMIARHRARKPIHFVYILVSSIALAGSIILIGIFVPGTNLKSTWAALIHYQSHTFPQEFLFRSTWVLGLILPFVSFLMGAILSILHRKRIMGYTNRDPKANTRVEMITSLLMILVLPVAIWGRMEGNTGLVVILTLVCSLFAFLGEILALFIYKKVQAGSKANP